MKPADWTAPYFAHTWIHGLDPRVRIVTALLLAGVVVALKHLPPLMLAAAIAALLAQGHELHTDSTNSALYRAQDYTWRSLQAGYRAGGGQLLPNRLFWAAASRGRA